MEGAVARTSLLAGARRLAALVGGAVVLVGGLSAVVGAALDSSVARATATGLYLVGCLLIVLGVFSGLRGPLRPGGDDDDRGSLGSLFGFGVFASGIRAASAEERTDARSTTWLFFVVGVALVLVGIVIDPRTDLF